MKFAALPAETDRLVLRERVAVLNDDVMADRMRDRRNAGARAIERPDDLYALFAGMGRARREMLAVAYLDAEACVAGVRLGYSAHRATIALPVRRILADALALDCRAIMLAHNHPGGDATPSRADLVATSGLADLVRLVGVRLIDHLVIAEGRWESFRARGLL